jgi:hypothetical protein
MISAVCNGVTSDYSHFVRAAKCIVFDVMPMVKWIISETPYEVRNSAPFCV